nr:hypothetical protein [uncultured Flavobacterium sp.]
MLERTENDNKKEATLLKSLFYLGPIGKRVPSCSHFLNGIPPSSDTRAMPELAKQ